MRKFSLHFCYKTSSRKDDLLSVHDTDTRDLYFVVMKPGDFVHNQYEGYMGHHRLLDHLENILHSMRYDMDPFEHIQVDTPMAPSVMYHISDLDNAEVRELILDMIRDALRLDCERVSTE
jgi:hypothetical protein